MKKILITKNVAVLVVEAKNRFQNPKKTPQKHDYYTKTIVENRPKSYFQ